MDQTAASTALPELEVLSQDELAEVVGGADLRGFDAQKFVNEKTGMCGCGLAH